MEKSALRSQYQHQFRSCSNGEPLKVAIPKWPVRTSEHGMPSQVFSFCTNRDAMNVSSSPFSSKRSSVVSDTTDDGFVDSMSTCSFPPSPAPDLSSLKVKLDHEGFSNSGSVIRRQSSEVTSPNTSLSRRSSSSSASSVSMGRVKQMKSMFEQNAEEKNAPKRTPSFKTPLSPRKATEKFFKTPPSPKKTSGNLLLKTSISKTEVSVKESLRNVNTVKSVQENSGVKSLSTSSIAPTESQQASFYSPENKTSVATVGVVLKPKTYETHHDTIKIGIPSKINETVGLPMKSEVKNKDASVGVPQRERKTSTAELKLITSSLHPHQTEKLTKLVTKTETNKTTILVKEISKPSPIQHQQSLESGSSDKLATRQPVAENHINSQLNSSESHENAQVTVDKKVIAEKTGNGVLCLAENLNDSLQPHLNEQYINAESEASECTTSCYDEQNLVSDNTQLSHQALTKPSDQVFFRAGGIAQLEDARDEKIGGTFVALQAHCRRYLGRQKLKKLKLQHMAVSCIQRNVKKFMAIREWPWWRLYTKVKPLLDVHRTEEELRNKDVELDQLKTRFEKLEKERNELKQTVDKLETKLSEMTADFQEEHTTSNQATGLLETETAQRIKLEKDLKDIQSKFNNLQRKHESTELDLMQTRLLVASLDEELDEEEDNGDSIYRQKYERSKREVEFVKKKLGQAHEEEVEAHTAVKKQLERKLGEANAESDELRRQIQNLKRKSQKINADTQDLKLHLEEQVSRNSDLEKKQRKFDNELRKVNEQLKDEKFQREKLQRERDEVSAEKYSTEQELKNLKMDKEIEVEKITRLESELLEFSSTGNKDDKEVLHLKRLKADLENKLAEQEEELDDQAGIIQQLEQTKLRLEMSQEKSRQQHLKEVEEKEQEMEDMRAATQKKVRGMESQLEEEYEEKQKILKDKRELERKLQALGEHKMTPDRETEKRLRRDLKRTRALLQDAHVMLEKQKEAAGSRGTVKQLRNQLEDAEYATTAAIKARKGVEMEVTDLQQQLDDMSKSKQNLDDRLMAVSREKNDLQSRLEEHDEDYEELMKKYKAAVAQISTDRITIEAQSCQIEELGQEKEKLSEELSSLQSNLEYLQSSTVDKQVVVRLEAKIRDLESRLQLEQTAKGRAESQLARLKEQVEIITEEKDKIHDSEQRHLEETKRATRQLRDLREEHAEVQRKEAESSQRKHDLEVKVESLESDYEQSRADLRLAFKRISDLQAVIEDEFESEEDSLMDSDENEDSDTYSDDEDSFLVNHTSGLSSHMSEGHSVRRSLLSNYNPDGHLPDFVSGSATDDSKLAAAGDR